MWIPRTVLKSLYYYYFFFLVFFTISFRTYFFYLAALRTCFRAAPFSAAHPTATVEYTSGDTSSADSFSTHVRVRGCPVIMTRISI